MSNNTDTIPHIAEVTDYRWFLAPDVGHSATFTISSPDCHFTFKIKAMASRSKPNSKTLLLSVMTGQDNESSFSYIGILVKDEIRPPAILSTKGSKVSQSAKSVRSLLWVLNKIKLGLELPEGYHCQHSGKCARCGRKLTTPESITLGLGPVCVGLSGW